MKLQTKRLLLRPWRIDDRDLFAKFNADLRVMQYFPSPLSREESDSLAAALQAHIEQHGWGLWAVEVPNVVSFAGFVGLARPRLNSQFTPCTEIGWRLGSAFWGRGYASEGELATLEFGFQYLNLDEIVSCTTVTNLPSRRVMERIGMVRNTENDFDHPSLPVGHPLRRHVLYRKSKGG